MDNTKRFTVFNWKTITCKKCGENVRVTTKAIKYCPPCLAIVNTEYYQNYIEKYCELKEFYDEYEEARQAESERYIGFLKKKISEDGMIRGLSLGELKDQKIKQTDEQEVSRDYYSKDLDPIAEEEARITREIRNRMKNIPNLRGGE